MPTLPTWEHTASPPTPIASGRREMAQTSELLRSSLVLRQNAGSAHRRIRPLSRHHRPIAWHSPSSPLFDADGAARRFRPDGTQKTLGTIAFTALINGLVQRRQFIQRTAFHENNDITHHLRHAGHGRADAGVQRSSASIDPDSRRRPDDRLQHQRFDHRRSDLTSRRGSTCSTAERSDRRRSVDGTASTGPRISSLATS